MDAAIDSAEVKAPEVLYRLRSDLVLSLDGPTTVVKDPIGGAFVRLATAELVIARQFDGKSTLDQIRERLAARHVRVSPEKLAAFRDKLRELQLITGEGEEVAGKELSLEGLSRSGLARLVVIPLPIRIDPDRFLGRLVGPLGFFFTKTFAAVSVVMFALAIQVWLDRWDEIVILFRSYRATGKTVLSVWAVTSASVALHELAHGLMTKVYGGRVRRIGVFLYYFLLIFYTDVSDAWLFRERRKQFMVMAVGAWTSALLWATATIAWRVTVPGSGLNHAAALFMNVNIAISTLTLIPLVLSDGYHMLSCVLDIPNLRARSFGYAGAVLRRTLLRSSEPLPRSTPREARIFLIYAVLAYPFMTLLFAWAGIRFFGWFLGSLKAWGLVFLATFFAVRFRDKSRNAVRWRRLIIPGAIAIAALIPVPLHVSGRFEVLNPEPTQVRTLADGVLIEISVKAGEEVKVGQVVARLLDEELVREKRERDAELEQVRAQLELVENGYAPEEVESARLAVAEHRDALALAELALKRDREMHGRGFVTEKELDASQREVVRRRGLLGRAQQEHQLKLGGRRKEEIREARAKVDMLVARIATLDQRLVWTKVTANVSGQVISSDDQLAELIGRSLPRGTGIVAVVDPHKLIARVHVPENELGDVTVGQEVTLRAYGAPADAMSGAIVWIQPEVQRPANAPATVAALTRVEGPQTPLPLGTSGMAKIDCGTRLFGYLIYRRLLRSLFVELWSWW